MLDVNKPKYKAIIEVTIVTGESFNFFKKSYAPLFGLQRIDTRYIDKGNKEFRVLIYSDYEIIVTNQVHDLDDKIYSAGILVVCKHTGNSCYYS